MLRELSATPCPINDSQILRGRRDSISSFGGDDTANIDFTTEFKASFRDVKPRRPPGKLKKVAGTGLGFTIHEDEELRIQHAPTSHMKNNSSVGHTARQGSVSQAPQKPKNRVSFTQTVGPHETTPKSTVSSRFRKAPRQASPEIAAHADTQYGSVDATLPAFASPTISKPARRGTLYIPNDDTTMPSMYMGIFSPLKKEPQWVERRQAGANEEHTGLGAQMLKKRGGAQGQSVLVASPKRGPLHATTRPLQATIVSEDRVGSRTGKENLPPGSSGRDEGLMKKKPRKSILVTTVPPMGDHANAHASRAPSRLLQPTASTSARCKEFNSGSNPVPRQACRSGSRGAASKPMATKPAMTQPKLSTPRAFSAASVMPKVPTRFIVPSVKVETVDQSFPLLAEGLPEVSMYEDNWLGQQEVAITQLVNNLFAATNPGNDASDAALLRLQLLERYNSTEMLLTHKRVQGALFYGALSIPQEVLAGGHRLYSDLGRRKAFCDLWLETYDSCTLQAALEVIVGRTMNATRQGSSPSSPSAAPSKHKRLLRLFIETFLMRNEDGRPDSEANQASWSYSRTLLRSLMLIKALDIVKTTLEIGSSRMFLSTSPYRESSSVVLGLMQLLNPSAGDPLRNLSLLGYSVHHAQYPLEEFEYQVQNLAVELRDGVRLTRLVELLLYRSTSKQLAHEHDPEATSTILMPTGEVLGLADGLRNWPLSQHLKFPCISRATRLFNVQIALSAIQSVEGMGTMTEGISADDIVDGFREKTMKLLWALTSKWGLEGLVDWRDVEAEIQRLRRARGQVGYSCDYRDDLDVEGDDEGYLRCRTLLKAWAKAIASTRAMNVRNFTTSFADGRVFEAIVNEYEPYLACDAIIRTNKSLSGRLKALGCSEQFSQLFAVGPGAVAKHHIFDRDFVLASLAFLCSRLLAPSKRSRAAVVIQRGWRKHFRMILQKRKQKLKKVALACAEAVQGKHQQVIAKEIIVKAWRGYRARKQVGTDGKHAPSLWLPKLDVNQTMIEESDIWLRL